MERIRLILVGGFLGAGKTTLLVHAARRLASRGSKVGLITNDQAAGLVDTEIVKQESAGVQEVSGGCFCCRFGDLVSSLKSLLREFSPDVILAEPVGSCTDLSATVLQPMKKLYAEVVSLAPFSVLVDPVRLREVLSSDEASPFPESVLYIFRKQIEEADLVVLNKTDLLSPAESAELQETITARFPGREVLAVSALNARDVDGWLDVVTADAAAGRRLAEVDYDTYADGEAELGWLNATVRLRAERPVEWQSFCLDLLRTMQEELRARSAQVAHLKVFLKGKRVAVTGSLTHLAGRPAVRGAAESNPSAAQLLVNARVHLDPDELRKLVEKCVNAAKGDAVRAEIVEVRSFRPARPEPTHRFDGVV